MNNCTIHHYSLVGRLIRSIFVVAAAGGLAWTGVAQSAATAAAFSEDEREFLGKTATETAALIEGSQLAEGRTRFVAVRQFAQETTKELQKVQTNLQDVVARSGAAMIATPNAEEKAEILDDVREETDEDFEEAYVETVVNILEDMIGRFNELAEDADHPAVQQFAQSHLAALRIHHERAQDLDGRLDDIMEG